MERKVYPRCHKCGDVINPHLYENCEEMFEVHGDWICSICFEEWLKKDKPMTLAEVADVLNIRVKEME